MSISKTAGGAVAAVWVAASAWAAGDAWTTDFDAALTAAGKENKHLLVDFSGSDWCGWCIKLDDELFRKARHPGLVGAEKARALDAALAAVPESMIADHVADMEEVVRIDADGALGLKSRHFKRLLMEKARVARQARDLPGAIEFYEQILAEAKPSGEELQDLLMEKSSLRYASDDKAAAEKAMDDALAAAPESKSAQRIKDLRAKVFPDGPAKP